MSDALLAWIAQLANARANVVIQADKKRMCAQARQKDEALR